MRTTGFVECLLAPATLALVSVFVGTLLPEIGHSAPVGVNFQTEGRPGFPAGKTVTASAFGIAVADWSDMATGANGTQSVTRSAGSLTVSWSAANTWGVDIGAPPGEHDVFWGYLDDGAAGFSVTISGLTNVFSTYVVQTISATDNGVGFLPATVMTISNGPQVLTYSSPRTSAGALGGVSTASASLTDDTITIHGLPKTAFFERGTLAGIIITDVPVIQIQPQAPTNTVDEGESFSLSVGAIGPNLSYQWRKDGNHISGANSSTYTKSGTTTRDSGSYDVLVANAYGSVTSSNVTVTVHSGQARESEGIAPVIFSARPVTFQLYPRHRQSNLANVPILGTVLLPLYDGITVHVDREGVEYTNVTRTLSYANGQAKFSIVVPIPAELANYNFKIYVQSGANKTLVGSAESVVAGDALLINGQSNAEAKSFYGSANQNQSLFVRSFGTRTENAVATRNDLAWYQAEGDAKEGPGAIGQWGLRLGRLIADTHHVPVAIISQANGGSPIPYFQRNDSDPEDLSTDYGRALYRLRKAGLADALRAIFWYQGEAEFDNAAAHESGFTSLHQDWLADFPSVEKIYIHQVHTGCGVTKTDLQNRQRRFADSLDKVEVMSTTGIDAHDGCHYAYANGYELIGNHVFKLAKRDLYGAARENNIEPPNIRYAYFSKPTRDEITLVMRNASDTLVWEAGAEADFQVNDIASSVLSGSVSNSTIILKLSAAATSGTVITYKGHPGIYPAAEVSRWAKNSSGVGLLCFYRQPILAVPPPTAKPAANATAPMPPNGATNVSVPVELAWTPASNMISQAVYFGTNALGTFRRDTSGSIFYAGLLAPGTTYFWRVDTTTSSGVIAGQVWSFTTLVPPAVARYPFEGTADDASGNGYHGTASSITYVGGKVGAEAAQFNGTSSYVQIPRVIDSDFSVALWIRTTDVGGTGSQWWSGKGLLDGEVSGTTDDWGTAVLNSRFVLGIGNPDTTISSTTLINDGAWHHLVATRDSVSGQIRLYVDGALDASGTGPIGPKGAAPNLRIGSILTGGGFLNGAIDEVRLYDRVLSGSEVWSLALLTVNPNVTYAGRASALSANILGVSNAWSATGPLPASGGSQHASLLTVNEPELLRAEIAHASTIGQGDRTRSEASVANFALDLGGNIITAEFLAARGMAVWQTNSTELSGSSEIESLCINGQPIVISGEPNQTISLGNGAVILNAQTTSTNEITVRALHLVVNGAADVSVASAQAGITGTLPPLCEGEDSITGSGWITDTPSGEKGKFSLKAGLKDTILSGHVTYKDDGSDMKMKATSTTRYQGGATAKARHIEGSAEINGVDGFTYSLDVADNGKSGDQDTFSISLSNGYRASGFLEGGNIQLHSPCE